MIDMIIIKKINNKLIGRREGTEIHCKIHWQYFARLEDKL